MSVKTHTHDRLVHIMVEGPRGLEKDYYEYSITEVLEPNWGADADGNRGMTQHYFGEPEIDGNVHDGFIHEVLEAIKEDIETINFELGE